MLIEPEGLRLLEKLLEICPEKRITAKEALSHEYFSELSWTKSFFFFTSINLKHFILLKVYCLINEYHK